MHNLILFASGKGSNVQAIIDYFAANTVVKPALIVCNKMGAGVLDIAKKHQIPTLMIDKASFGNETFISALEQYNPSLIVLAGFLWKIPETVVKAFSGKIINIHPALLPKYGGKGMYGHHVHESVIKNEEKESGITIHYVNEHYDEGNVIMQAHCSVLPNDIAADLALRIHQLEHYFFPRTIAFLLGQQ